MDNPPDRELAEKDLDSLSESRTNRTRHVVELRHGSPSGLFAVVGTYEYRAEHLTGLHGWPPVMSRVHWPIGADVPVPSGWRRSGNAFVSDGTSKTIRTVRRRVDRLVQRLNDGEEPFSGPPFEVLDQGQRTTKPSVDERRALYRDVLGRLAMPWMEFEEIRRTGSIGFLLRPEFAGRPGITVSLTHRLSGHLVTLRPNERGRVESPDRMPDGWYLIQVHDGENERSTWSVLLRPHSNDVKDEPDRVFQPRRQKQSTVELSKWNPDLTLWDEWVRAHNAIRQGRAPSVRWVVSFVRSVVPLDRRRVRRRELVEIILHKNTTGRGRTRRPFTKPSGLATALTAECLGVRAKDVRRAVRADTSSCVS